jgi:hypothetical protein
MQKAGTGRRFQVDINRRSQQAVFITKKRFRGNVAHQYRSPAAGLPIQAGSHVVSNGTAVNSELLCSECKKGDASISK